MLLNDWYCSNQNKLICFSCDRYFGPVDHPNKYTLCNVLLAQIQCYLPTVLQEMIAEEHIGKYPILLPCDVLHLRNGEQNSVVLFKFPLVLEIKGAFISSMTMGDADWATEDPLNIELTIKYDYAILQLYDKIVESLSKKEHAIGIFMDLSKAFDTI